MSVAHSRRLEGSDKESSYTGAKQFEIIGLVTLTHLQQTSFVSTGYHWLTAAHRKYKVFSAKLGKIQEASVLNLLINFLVFVTLVF